MIDYMQDGVQIIAGERQRQIEQGYTAEYDDQHRDSEMAYSAACYAAPQPIFLQHGSSYFFSAWERGSCHQKPAYDNDPDERIQELAKAGALVAAEIDRLLRAIHRAADRELEIDAAYVEEQLVTLPGEVFLRPKGA